MAQSAHVVQNARRLAAGCRPPFSDTRILWVSGNSAHLVLVTGQKLAVGHTHGHTALTVRVTEHTITVDLDDGAWPILRGTTQPVRSWQAPRPRTSPSPDSPTAGGRSP
jgi:hypothetical protein